MSGGDTAKRERVKAASWIRPKAAHKAMVWSFLSRRMPIIFSIRGAESYKPETKQQVFKPICEKNFLFDVTVSFRLKSDRKGIIDLSDATSWKMEKAHRDIFRDGEQLSESHGERLAEWSRGSIYDQPATTSSLPSDDLIDAARVAATDGMAAYQKFWAGLTKEAKAQLLPQHEALKSAAAKSDAAR